MPAEVLSRLALNRALLERQMLLRRAPAPGSAAGRPGRVIRAVQHLVGLQAQAPFPPYYGLWSRLEDFRPGELAALITGRQVVRIALMRGTIHLVSARDCLTLRPLMQPVLDKALAATYGRQLAGVDTRALAAAGRALTEAEPRTFRDLGTLLAEQHPGCPAAALAQGVRGLVPLVQVPPRAVWGAAGLARHTPAEAWLGRGAGSRRVAGRDGAALPGRVRPGQRARRAGLVRADRAARGRRPAAARAARVAGRERHRAARPAGRTAARSGIAAPVRLVASMTT